MFNVPFSLLIHQLDFLFECIFPLKKNMFKFKGFLAYFLFKFSEVKDSDQVIKIPMYFTVKWMVSKSCFFIQMKPF